MSDLMFAAGCFVSFCAAAMCLSVYLHSKKIKDAVLADDCKPASPVESFNVNPGRVLRAGRPFRTDHEDAVVSSLPDMDRVTTEEDRHARPAVRWARKVRKPLDSCSDWSPTITRPTPNISGVSTGRISLSEAAFREHTSDTMLTNTLLMSQTNSYVASVDTTVAPQSSQSYEPVYCPASESSVASCDVSASSCGCD